jgi:murein DD-endopeptidase MepM/ murein hydrolase activator NlpD
VANNPGLFITIGGTSNPLKDALRDGRTSLAEFARAATTEAKQAQAGIQAALADPHLADGLEKSLAAQIKAISSGAQAAIKAATATPGGLDVSGRLTAAGSEAAAAAIDRLIVAERGKLVAVEAATAADATQAAQLRVVAIATEQGIALLERSRVAYADQAGVLGAVEKEMGGVAAASGAVIAGHQGMSVSSQILMHSVRSAGDSFAAGLPPMMIFTEQLGRLSEAAAYSGPEGALGKIGAFMGTEWGIALTLGVTVLGTLIGKLGLFDDKLDKTAEVLGKVKFATDAVHDAQSILGNIMDLTTGRITDQNKALRDLAEAHLLVARVEAETRAAQAARDINDLAKPHTTFGGGFGGGFTISPESGPEVAVLQRVQSGENSAKQGLEQLENLRAAGSLTAETFAKAAAAIANFNAETKNVAALGAALRVLSGDANAKDRALILKKKNDPNSGFETAHFGSPVDSGATGVGFGELRGARAGVAAHQHAGTDIQTHVGTIVRAVAAGVVSFAGSRGNYGNVVYVDTGGAQVRDAHLSRITAKQGERVEKGDIIGYSGGAKGAAGAGDSTGPHLHHEVRVGGRPVNPFGDYRIDGGKLEDIAAREQAKVQQAAEKAARDHEALDSAMAGSKEEAVRIAREGVTDATRLAALDKDQLRAGLARKLIQNSKLALDHAELNSLDKANEAAAEKAVDAKLALHDADEASDRRRDALTLEAKLLDIQGQLAPTLAERLRIALALLENDRQQQLLANDRKLLDGQIDKPEHDAAAAGINATTEGQGKIVRRDNQGPVAAYGAEIHKNVDDMETAFQNIEAHALQNLEEGLLGLVNGTESVASAFKKMAASIIADLARIAIEKAILSIFALKTGNVPGAATGSIPGFASGVISGPGTGTSDSILAYHAKLGPIRVSNGESIITAEGTRRHRRLLKAINDNTLPAFAEGMVPAMSYPALPSAGSLRSGGGSPSQYFDLRGAVVTEDLYRQMSAISARHAALALSAAPGLVREELGAAALQQIPA